jgi:hypothetical protein
MHFRQNRKANQNGRWGPIDIVVFFEYRSPSIESLRALELCPAPPSQAPIPVWDRVLSRGGGGTTDSAAERVVIPLSFLH